MKNYNNFVYQMWRQNCAEREGWNQPLLTLEEYEMMNGTFLEDTYWMQEVGSMVWNEKKHDYVYPS